MKGQSALSSVWKTNADGAEVTVTELYHGNVVEL